MTRLSEHTVYYTNLFCPSTHDSILFFVFFVGLSIKQKLVFIIWRPFSSSAVKKNKKQQDPKEIICADQFGISFLSQTRFILFFTYFSFFSHFQTNCFTLFWSWILLTFRSIVSALSKQTLAKLMTSAQVRRHFATDKPRDYQVQSRSVSHFRNKILSHQYTAIYLTWPDS